MIAYKPCYKFKDYGLVAVIVLLSLWDSVKALNVINGSVVNRRSGNPPTAENGEDSLMDLLEAKYRFHNDERSTRFSIAEEDTRKQYQGSAADKQLDWAFRAIAGRRIVGGMDTSISMYPYNVAISRNGKHWCGGSVIDEQWILTAGHCLESAHDGNKKKLMPFIIRAGSSFHNRGGYQARINKVFFFPNYAPGNADFDYSLLRLDRPLPIGRNIAVLNLPSKEYAVEPGDLLIVSGWGSTDETGFGHIPDRIRFVPVPIMKLKQCQQAYRFYITPRMLCAGYATGGKDACNHDSGGPAVRDGVLIGIVSFGGKRCGDPNSPGVYSRVSELTDWVQKTITENEASTVPELIPKIQKAREREKELQRFKARVEDKKNKIKNWLRDTLNSPSFIALAKKKLIEAGHNLRRSYRDDDEPQITSTMTDEEIDDINLNNLINESIVGAVDDDVDDQDSRSNWLLHALALQEAVLSEDTASVKSKEDSGNTDDEDVKRIIAILSKVSAET